MPRKQAIRCGPHALAGSREAKRLAAVVLEVLSGLRDTREGSTAMGVALPRYYQLETRALQGLITALEPRPKGRQRTADDRLRALEQEHRRVRRELVRHQALLRSAQRSLGIAAVTTQAKGSKIGGSGKGRSQAAATAGGRRRRRKTARGLRAVKALRAAAGSGAGSSEPAGKPASAPSSPPSTPRPGSA